MEIITRPELQNYLGAGTACDVARATLITELANGLVTGSWKNPTQPGDPIPTWVKAITLEVAARPLRNPGGLSSVTRHVDDASRTERLSDLAARAGLFLTDEEERRLAGGGSKMSRGRYGTIRLGIG